MFPRHFHKGVAGCDSPRDFGAFDDEQAVMPATRYRRVPAFVIFSGTENNSANALSLFAMPAP